MVLTLGLLALRQGLERLYDFQPLGSATEKPSLSLYVRQPLGSLAAGSSLASPESSVSFRS